MRAKIRFLIFGGTLFCSLSHTACVLADDTQSAVILQDEKNDRAPEVLRVLYEYRVKDQSLEQRTRLEQAILQAGDLHMEYATESLLSRLDIRYVTPTDNDVILGPDKIFPAVHSLFMIGKPALPDIIETLSESPVDNSPYNFFSTRSLCANLVRDICGSQTNAPVIALLNSYADEYEHRAQRLQLLSQWVRDVRKEEFPTATADEKNQGDEYALLVQLYNRGEDTDEAILVKRLGYMHCVAASYPIAQRLDMKITENDWDVYPALPALMQIGKPSLPFIVRAMSEPQRSKVFLNNGLKAMVDILGDSEEASKMLSLAAEQYKIKAATLRSRGKSP